MANHAKIAQQLARKLFALSLADGLVSAERVEGVLAYVEKHHLANPVMVLKAYERYIATELAKSEAVVEHAGPVSDAMLAAIASAMTKKYGRTVKATSKPSAALLAGIRVHVGDDIYESSVAGQLGSLGAV